MPVAGKGVSKTPSVSRAAQRPRVIGGQQALFRSTAYCGLGLTRSTNVRSSPRWNSVPELPPVVVMSSLSES